MARNRFDVDESLETPFNAGHLKRALIYAKKVKWQLVISFVIAIVSTLLGLITPKINQWVLDIVVPNKDYTLLIQLALMFLGIVIVCITLNLIRSRIMAHASQQIIYDIRKDLFAHLQRLPFSYYDSRPAGKILVRVINYVNSVSDILTSGIINTILELLNVFFIVFFMFSTEPTLAWIAIGGLPVFAFFIFLIKPIQRKAWQEQSNKGSNFNAYLAESIDGVRVSQLFTRQEVNASIMKRLSIACRKIWMKAQMVSHTVWFTSGLISTAASCLLYWAGMHWVDGSVVTYGVVLAMASYVSRFWQPITNLANIYNSLINNMAYLERIFETMDEPVTVDDKPGAIELPEITGEVNFRDVEFGYEEGQVVLENLNLHVKAGESIALVGPTGAGKSTVVNLLCRFYNVRKGGITLTDKDGQEHDITDVTLHSLRAQLGIMLQDSFIFSGTIEDNIRYGNLDASMEAIRKAAQIVRADDFISEMPQGYKTEVNERGSSLSQGQRQLISFARTIVSDPAILILDEATSSIDTKTEKLLQDGLQAMLVGRTSFIIAHRLSTIKNCDRILYICNRGILEAGSHDELMARKGAYWELYTTQAREQGLEV